MKALNTARAYIGFITKAMGRCISLYNIQRKAEAKLSKALKSTRKKGVKK